MSYKLLPLTESGELIKNNVKLQSPRNLVIVKYPKSGSTLSLVDVPKILILDTEKGTSDFGASNRVHINITDDYIDTPRFGLIPKGLHDVVDELYKANKMEEYWRLNNEMENTFDSTKKEGLYQDIITLVNSIPFPIVAVDTITSLVETSNTTALAEYNSNIKDKTKHRTDIKKVDEYGGARYVRRKFQEIKDFIEQNAAPFIQYHGHVGERKKIVKKSTEDVSALDIALEGIQSLTFTSKANAVCVFYRNEKGCFLDFDKRDETALGGRTLHLTNKVIKIADIVKDEDLQAGKLPKTYWSEIYPEINFN